MKEEKTDIRALYFDATNHQSNAVHITFLPAMSEEAGSKVTRFQERLRHATQDNPLCPRHTSMMPYPGTKLHAPIQDNTPPLRDSEHQTVQVVLSFECWSTKSPIQDAPMADWFRSSVKPKSIHAPPAST
jgi:hypothetical protein